MAWQQCSCPQTRTQMKTLLRCQQSNNNISVFFRRFCSSVSFESNTSISRGNITTFDPLHLFNGYTKFNNYTLTGTKIFHAHFLKSNFLHTHVFVFNRLVDLYSRSSAIKYALQLFEAIPNRDTGSWNLIISCHNQHFRFQHSWRTFCRMHSLGFMPDEFTYGSVIAACNALQSHFLGKKIYSLALRDGLFSNSYVQSGMIDLFSKSGSFQDALRVFSDGSFENVVCWNAIISGAVINKEEWVALKLFFRMHRGLLRPNKFTFPSVLTACAALEEIFLGRGVHGLVIKHGMGEDVYVGTALLDLYAKCGDMEEAVKVFSRMSIRNVVSWSAIISGFVQTGNSVLALEYFKQMIYLKEEISNYTITSVLNACGNPAMFMDAVQIHCWILKTGFYSDPAVKASLINLYVNIGVLDLSELVFSDAEDFKHPSMWASMISGFAKNGTRGRTIYLFKRMLREGLSPDKFCSSSVLSVVDSLELGKQIHSYTLKAGFLLDVSVASSLFTMYSKCGSLEESYEVFQQIPEKDNVSWASMVSGFAEHGYAYEAIQLFRTMQSEEVTLDIMTLKTVMTVCSSLPYLKLGKEIHGYAIRRGDGENILCGGALVNMYAKCGALHLARSAFDIMPRKDQVSCSSLVSGYAQSGYLKEALQLFQEILAADFVVDSFTISSVLGAVGLLNRSDIGSMLHSYNLKVGLDSLATVGSSLVMMYSKCGNIDDCRKGFEQIAKPDLISWTSMITSYAQHGKGFEALKVYELMRNSGIKPDSVTFIGVLSACSHNGLVEEGYFHLDSMVKDFGIKPGHQHYACMVDLLGRSGRLKEAERFINNMPIEADALVWGTLLAACKVHGDVNLGRIAAEKFIELEPSSDGAYVSLSNICADFGQFDEVLKIRSEMEGTGVKKQPAWSYV